MHGAQDFLPRSPKCSKLQSRTLALKKFCRSHLDPTPCVPSSSRVVLRSREGRTQGPTTDDSPTNGHYTGETFHRHTFYDVQLVLYVCVSDSIYIMPPNHRPLRSPTLCISYLSRECRLSTVRKQLAHSRSHDVVNNP